MAVRTSLTPCGDVTGMSSLQKEGSRSMVVQILRHHHRLWHVCRATRDSKEILHSTESLCHCGTGCYIEKFDCATLLGHTTASFDPPLFFDGFLEYSDYGGAVLVMSSGGANMSHIYMHESHAHKGGGVAVLGNGIVSMSHGQVAHCHAIAPLAFMPPHYYQIFISNSAFRGNVVNGGRMAKQSGVAPSACTGHQRATATLSSSTTRMMDRSRFFRAPVD